MSTHDTAEPTQHGMPQPAGSSRVDAGVLAQVGALASALVASACCWLPLLLIAVGVSGGALSATFGAWRPVLLPVTFALLGLAFYFTYRKPRAAAQSTGGTAAGEDACCAVPATESKGEACCPPAGGRVSALKKVNKVMLWVVTAFVLAFAFFPNYVGYLLGGSDTLAARNDLDKVVVKIEGMTCEACAASIEKGLRDVPGVAAAEVSYEKGEAVVGIAKGTPAPREAILGAVSSAGNYTGHFTDQVQWTLAVAGMTCEGCAAGLQAELAKVPGVSNASVSYAQGQAVVTADPSVATETLRNAVSEAGYTLASATRNGQGTRAGDQR